MDLKGTDLEWVEKEYRFVRNLVLSAKDILHLEDVLRLMAQSRTEFIKLDNIRTDKQKQIEELNREHKQVVADTETAKQMQSEVLGKLRAEYVRQEETAKVSLAEIVAKGSLEQVKNDKKVAEQDKLVAESQAKLDVIETKADAVEKRSALAIARIKKAKDEIALVEE